MRRQRQRQQIDDVVETVPAMSPLGVGISFDTPHSRIGADPPVFQAGDYEFDDVDMSDSEDRDDYDGDVGDAHLGPESSSSKKKDGPWLVTGPLPGGPYSADTIPSFLGHIASHIWHGENRLRLRCQTRPSWLKELKLWFNKMDDGGKRIIERTGLSHLPATMYDIIDADLISAFVERWQPDTNSFHMPFGEMTIMMHDVHYILGISVDGMLVTKDGGTSYMKNVVMEMLGVGEDTMRQIWAHGAVPAKTVAKKSCEVGRPLHASMAGWMWLMFSGTLFVDKSGSRVRPECALEVKDDLDHVREYAWGTATLAYLYRQLGTASRYHCKQISGCLTLLQAWIYEYFPCFRPHPRYPIREGQPRAMSWTPRPEAKGLRLDALRMRIDQMTAAEV